MRRRQLRRRPSGTRTFVRLGTIVGTVVVGFGLAADASAGTMPAIALSSTTVAPGGGVDVIVYRCNAGDEIGYVVDGVSYTETCLLTGDAVLQAQVSNQPGSYQVVATTPSGQLTADYTVAEPGQPALDVLGINFPGRFVSFSVRGCTAGTQAVADVAGQQLTADCESGTFGPSAVFGYLSNDAASSINPLTVTLTQPAAVLQGTIFFRQFGAVEEPGPVTTPDPGLAGTGPGDSTVTQLVAAAGAVGLGITCVAWARRRRATT